MTDTQTLASAILLAQPRNRVPTPEDRAEAWGGLFGIAIVVIFFIGVYLLIRSIIRKIRGDY